VFYSDGYREGLHIPVCALNSIYIRVIEELEEEEKNKPQELISSVQNPTLMNKSL
jgi:hypothetical protein